jgi:hypothetical protein
MKKILFSLAVFFVSSSVFAQDSKPFSLGFEEASHSTILKAERKVWIHLPDGYQENSADHYPVIYVLDGQSLFRSLVAITEHLSNEHLAPKMIVVGILQGDRMVDLTFGTDKEYSGASGGGEQFLDYIEKELIPIIDSKYHTAPYRTFVGHSVGGLTVVHSLVHRPYLFNSYISLEGALWWNEHQLVKDAKAQLSKPSYGGKTLFLALANHMVKPMSLQQIRRDKTEDSDLVRANLELIDDLAKRKKSALRLGQRYYPNDHHSSLTLQAQQDALKFIFDFYPLYIHNKQKDDPAFDVAARYAEHYQDVSLKMGYIVKPESAELVNHGYGFMSRKQYAKAEFFFQQLVSYYPNDPNSYDCLGDVYLAKGDKLKAIESFKKGLSIGEMKETRGKLDALLNGK